jgi:DinB superfamily
MEVLVTRLHTAILAAAAVCAAVPAAAQTAGQISEKERAAVVQHLTTMRDQVLAESAKLTDAQWSFKAAPERWSVGEVVQHLVLAEPFIFDLQQKTVKAPPATAEQLAAVKGKEEMIRKVIPDRTKKAQAPEPLQPTGPAAQGAKMGSQAETIAAFRERRGKTIDYASKTKDDLRGHVTESPLGPLDGYQWLVFIAAHSERHLAQIKEVKADPKFPKATAN